LSVTIREGTHIGIIDIIPVVGAADSHLIGVAMISMVDEIVSLVKVVDDIGTMCPRFTVVL
jgi:hypothetical protein